MLVGCLYLKKILFFNLMDYSFLIKIGYLSLIILSAIIIYLTMIFVLKVIKIEDLKGYIRK